MGNKLIHLYPRGYISFIIMDNVQTSLLQMLYLPRLFTIQTLLRTYSESKEQVVLCFTRCIEKQENHGELLPNSTDSTCSWNICYTGSLSPPRAVAGTSLMLTLPDYSSPFQSNQPTLAPLLRPLKCDYVIFQLLDLSTQ